MEKCRMLLFKGISPILLLLVLMVGSAGAVTYNITAAPVSLLMPDGTTVPAWGYGLNGGTPTVPGPVITVPEGDNQLIINLTNNLPESTSLHIMGQALSNNGGPTFVGGRVMSFSHETAPNTTQEYRWDNFKPGTYLLQSGTNPARQVQMGLFAPVTKDSGLSLAYDGVDYTAEMVVVFHEVDAAMQNAIVGGTYKSSIHRNPDFFLINGEGGLDLVPSVSVGDRLLVRFVNGGLQTHVPQVLGMYGTIVAEDGIPYKYAGEQCSFELPPGKTMDVVIVPAADGRYPMYDGRLLGDALAYLDVGLPSVPVAVNDAYTMNEDTVLNVPAPGVLGNDRDPAGNPLIGATLVTQAANGTATLNADGSFTYTPAPDFFGVDTFTYKAFDGTGAESNVATVTITINPVTDPTTVPSAVDDLFVTDEDVPLDVAAPGVLGNDVPSTGNQLTSATLVTQTANGVLAFNADGSFVYTPAAGFNGTDTFTYTAADSSGAQSNVATVTITVASVNDRPVAVDDRPTVARNSSGNVFNLVANDYDPDGTVVASSLRVDGEVNGQFTTANGGTVVNNGDGTVTYTPARRFRGTDSFTYRVMDDLGALSLRKISSTATETTDESTVVYIEVVIRPGGGLNR